MPSEPDGWMAQHHRYDDTCWWGPFATREEAIAFCEENKVGATLIPLWRSVDWNRRQNIPPEWLDKETTQKGG